MHERASLDVIIIVRFLHTFALLCLLATFSRADDLADRLFKAGQRAEKAGDKIHAFLLYSKAAALAPSNADYAMRRSMLEADAAMSSEVSTHAVSEAIGRTSGAEPMTESEMFEAVAAKPPARLKGQDGLKSFDLRGDPKTVIEKVFAEYGLTAVFEGDYQLGQPFRFRIEDMRFEEVMRTLETQSNSFFIPVNEKIALIVKDTAQKRTEMSPTMSIAVPIPERISVQDAQEMTTAVVQTLEIRKFTLDPAKRMVYLRDRTPKVLAARAMFQNLSRGRAQVEVEIEFLEVTKNSSLGYGLQLPNSSSLINFGSFLHNTPSLSGFTSFLTFGGGASFFGIGVASSMVIATFSKSDSDVILKSQLVALDGQPATMHVGQKYPLVTASYSGGGTSTIGAGTGSGLIAPPTVNFEDLGLSLKITPSVHDGGEVTLEITSEFKVLGTIDGNGNPSISTRKYDGKVRLKADESAIVAGLLDTIDGSSVSGIFGVSNLPLIGRFLRSNSTNHSTDEVLLVLRPHIVNLPPWDMESPSIWIGSDSKPLSIF